MYSMMSILGAFSIRIQSIKSSLGALDAKPG